MEMWTIKILSFQRLNNRKNFRTRSRVLTSSIYFEKKYLKNFSPAVLRSGRRSRLRNWRSGFESRKSVRFLVKHSNMHSLCVEKEK
jgi:hypothetical protein